MRKTFPLALFALFGVTSGFAQTVMTTAPVQTAHVSQVARPVPQTPKSWTFVNTSPGNFWINFNAPATERVGSIWLKAGEHVSSTDYPGTESAEIDVIGTNAGFQYTIVSSPYTSGGGGNFDPSAGLEFFSGPGIYADGPNFVWNDGDVRFGYGGNYIGSFSSGGTVDLSNALLTLPADVPRLDYGQLYINGDFSADTICIGNGFETVIDSAGFFYGDASNLTNLPPPAGLILDSNLNLYGYSYTYISTGNSTYTGADGALDIGYNGGHTQLLSGPNTLGPLDGSALTIYGEPLINNGNGLYFDGGGTANTANHSNQSFNDFFHAYGFNTDTSLPGDGTFSLMNGNFTGDGDSIYVDGSIQSGSTFMFGDGSYLYAIRGQLLWRDAANTDHVLAP